MELRTFTNLLLGKPSTSTLGGLPELHLLFRDLRDSACSGVARVLWLGLQHEDVINPPPMAATHLTLGWGWDSEHGHSFPPVPAGSTLSQWHIWFVPSTPPFSRYWKLNLLLCILWLQQLWVVWYITPCGTPNTHCFDLNHGVLYATSTIKMTGFHRQIMLTQWWWLYLILILPPSHQLWLSAIYFRQAGQIRTR